MLVAVLLLAVNPAIVAEDEPKNWSNTAELGFVGTSGNTDSSSLGFKDKFVRSWDKSQLEIRAAGIRVETEQGNRVAVEQPGGGFTVVDPPSEINAENYALNARFNRDIKRTLFWFAGAGWDRNRPSGVDGRYVVEAGAGNHWKDEEGLVFKTTYGVTLTKQHDVVTIPGVEDSFGGARFTWDYLNQFGKSTTFTNVLIADLNLDETSDWRFDWLNGLAVAMSENLALKVGLRFLYRNEPSFEVIDLVDTSGTTLGTIPVQLDELDTIFTASLVVDF